MLYNLCWRDWERFNEKHKIYVLFFCCFKDFKNYSYVVNLISQIYSQPEITFARMEWFDARNVSVMFSIRSYEHVCIISKKQMFWMDIYPTMYEIKIGLKFVKMMHEKQIISEAFQDCSFS